jgi:hypothetical protein
MIEKLTDAQVSKMDDYVDEYVKIGLSTDNSISEEQIKIDINDLYVNLLNKAKPEQIVIVESPKAAWDYICKETGKNLSFVWPFLSGSFDSNIFAFYDFFMNELGVKIEEKLEEKYQIWKKTLNFGLVYPFDDVCIVTRKPDFISKKGNVLHNETGPAIKYRDGFNIYMLNGVRMTKEYVETPWDKLDPKCILKEENAEVRRELVRKIGIERFIKGTNAECIDAKGDYRLLMVDIGLKSGEKRPYLEMKNPSIMCYHIEGVEPSCKTVDDALYFRNKTKESPDKLS